MTYYTFSPISHPDGDMYSPTGINDSGETVGYYGMNTGGSGIHGFASSGPTYKTLTAPNGGNTYTSGVNNSGDVAGDYVLPYAPGASLIFYNGFVYSNGTYRTIQVPGAAQTFANGINNSGEVVGDYSVSGSASAEQGFIETNRGIITYNVPDSRSTIISGVNDNGMFVGSYKTQDKTTVGFVNENGETKTISIAGAFSTNVTGINNAGTIVGDYLDSSAVSHGFTEDSSGIITLIDFAPGVASTYLTGINNAGQVSGYAKSDFFTFAGFVGTPVCFASGTQISTTRGAVPVEQLSPGDIAITASGATRPIRWLGHRTLDCRRHRRPQDVMPVRIAAHAFGPSRPARDLVVSPGHSICLDLMGEVLVPAHALVNGTTIKQMEVDTVTYWHVELDSHDILLAENLPAESYLEMGNRSFFAEAEAIALRALPDAKRTHANFCRPFCDGGLVVGAIKSRLAAFAARRFNITDRGLRAAG